MCAENCESGDREMEGVHYFVTIIIVGVVYWRICDVEKTLREIKDILEKKS